VQNQVLITAVKAKKLNVEKYWSEVKVCKYCILLNARNAVMAFTEEDKVD